MNNKITSLQAAAKEKGFTPVLMVAMFLNLYSAVALVINLKMV